MSTSEGPGVDALRSLLYESRNLTHQLGTALEPVLSRPLDQLHHELARLAGAARPGTVDHSGQAYLAAKGLDVKQLEERVRAVAALPVFEEPSQAQLAGSGTAKDISERPSVDECLEAQLDALCQSVNADEQSKTANALSEWIKAAIQQSWGPAKKSLASLTKLGGHLAPGDVQASDSAPLHFAKTAAEAKESGQKTSSHVSIIKEANEARLKGVLYPLCQRFVSVARQFNHESASTLAEIGRLLACVVDEQHMLETKADPAKLRSENYALVTQPYESQANRQFRMRCIQRSKAHLEKSYVDFIDKVILQFPKEARVGGRASLADKVRGYLHIKFGRYQKRDTLEIIDELPIWAFLFYLLRCGDWSGAFSLVSKYESFFYRVDKNFVECIKAYMNAPDHVLPKELKLLVLKEYHRHKRNESRTDPFKIFIYYIMGKCEPQASFSPPMVVATIEDWIWLKLAFLVENNPAESSAHDLTLRQFQREIEDCGPEYFNMKKHDPFPYFKILILVSSYEKAINYLLNYDRHYFADALHVAAILAHYGILNVFREDTEHVSQQDDADGTLECVDFYQLVHEYVLLWVKDGDPVSAFHYILLLTLVPGHLYQQHMIEASSEWLLKTKEYTFAIGKQLPDGAAIQGELSRWSPLLNSAEDSNEPADLATLVALEAAKHCEAEGNAADAVLLYNLAKKYEKVLHVLSSQLNESLMRPTGGLNKSAELVSHARSVLQYYQNIDALDRDLVYAPSFQEHVEKLNLLIGFYEVFRAYHEKKWERVIELVQLHHLLPLSGSSSVPPMPLLRHLPTLLTFCMTSIAKMYAGLKRLLTAGGGRVKSHSPMSKAFVENRKAELRRSSRQLIVFAGKMASVLPSDVYASLTKADALMT